MSDFHILAGDGEYYEVIFHIPMPVQLNWFGLGGKGIPGAIVEDSEANKTSELPWISGVELAKIVAGELVEVKDTFRSIPEHSNAENISALKVRYAERYEETREKLKARYRFWHGEGNV